MAYAPIAAHCGWVENRVFGCLEQLPGGLVVCCRAFTGSEHACEYFYAVEEVLLVSTGV